MKKLFFCAAIVAAAVFGVMKATEVNNTMTDLQMENVELLAEGDGCKSIVCKDNKPDNCYHWDGSYTVNSKNRR